MIYTRNVLEEEKSEGQSKIGIEVNQGEVFFPGNL